MPYKEDLELTQKILDSFDVSAYIGTYETADEIMSAITEDVNNPFSDLDIELQDKFDGNLFKFMDDYSFVNYLKNRYGNDIKVVDRTTYWVWRNS